MKLLMFPACHDIVKLNSTKRFCKCKKSFGKYIDGLIVEVSKDAIILGFSNSSFSSAIRLSEKNKNGKIGIVFDAFIIPHNDYNIIRKN